ncbi:hypothetical protein [Helicobacter ailurogastricus]|uniref:hypothetical protein n=1 Tax=Helicobacter ailurogastricus TaxID=1578720 RepID=UPI002491F162|nr:hypothetical protein [Helicobacter ailurogastricus]
MFDEICGLTIASPKKLYFEHYMTLLGIVAGFMHGDANYHWNLTEFMNITSCFAKASNRKSVKEKIFDLHGVTFNGERLFDSWVLDEIMSLKWGESFSFMPNDKVLLALMESGLIAPSLDEIQGILALMRHSQWRGAFLRYIALLVCIALLRDKHIIRWHDVQLVLGGLYNSRAGRALNNRSVSYFDMIRFFLEDKNILIALHKIGIKVQKYGDKYLKTFVYPFAKKGLSDE